MTDARMKELLAKINQENAAKLANAAAHMHYHMHTDFDNAWESLAEEIEFAKTNERVHELLEFAYENGLLDQINDEMAIILAWVDYNDDDDSLTDDSLADLLEVYHRLVADGYDEAEAVDEAVWIVADAQ